MELPSPVISDAIDRGDPPERGARVQAARRDVPALGGGAEALRTSLVALRSDAEKAVHDGYHVLCVSDKEACKRGIDPIPSLLALGAVHQYLCQQGLRDRCSLIVQAGDIQEGHDVCCLVAFGADAVHPYLMLRLVKDGLTFKDPDTKQEIRLDAARVPGEPVRGPGGHDQEGHLQDGDHHHRGLPRGACCSRRSGSARS